MNHSPFQSPTRPKLYSCWRRSEEAWSSTGSRHSSRPGSSTASSSRPPSQPSIQTSTNPCQASGMATGASVVNPQHPQSQQQAGVTAVAPGLYCKSNNSSLSDVSVARNFQQLSVSAASRRAMFKTQKWSNSFDQPSLAQSQMSSPGRRRHHIATNQRENKSLDLDSGYSGRYACVQNFQIITRLRF